MKISFVIPAYNEEFLIQTCLESVQKEIRETLEMYPDLEVEVIVVNNASTDRTKKVAMRFHNVKVVNEFTKGLVWARRAGYLAAHGDIIANIDADTILPQGWLEKVLLEFSGDESLLALSGPQIYYDAPKLVRAMVKAWYVIGYVFNQINGFLFNNSSMLQGGNFVTRREAIERIGGYDTKIEFFGEDTQLGMRINKIGKVKWTFSLPIYASGRRIQAKGMLKTGYIYAMTFIYITFLSRPFTQEYDDVRYGDKGSVIYKLSRKIFAYSEK